MSTQILIELLYNAILLIAMVVVLSIFQISEKSGDYRKNTIAGILLGFIGITIILSAVQIGDGTIFDMRSVLVSTVGLFFGPIPAIIAGVMMAIYRIILGGAGAFPGVLVISTTALIGFLWRKYRLEKILKHGGKYYLEFYLFGLVVHLDMLLCMFAFPQNMQFGIFSQITLPVLLIYPAVTYVLCIIQKNQLVQNRLHSQLKVEKDRTDRIIDAANVGTWEQNMQTGELKVNERWATMLGYSLDELTPINMETWIELIHPEDLTNVKEQMDRVLSGEYKRLITLYRMKHKNGSWIWVECKGGTGTEVSTGTSKMIYGTHLDITERETVLKDLEISEQKYVSYVENAPDGIFITDRNGRYLEVNAAASITTGYSKKNCYI